MVKGEGKATGKVAGRVKVKPNKLPDYPVIIYYGPSALTKSAVSPHGVHCQHWCFAAIYFVFSVKMPVDKKKSYDLN